jgi:hypothetical protein
MPETAYRFDIPAGQGESGETASEYREENKHSEPPRHSRALRRMGV